MIYPLPEHRERAFFCSPLGFLRQYKEQVIEHFFEELNLSLRDSSVQIIGSQARFFMRYLEWDSSYFNRPMYRLEFADWVEDCPGLIKDLVTSLNLCKKELLERHGSYYIIIEIPSEDILIIQALGLAGFRLIETRLLYYQDDVQNFVWPQVYPVRQATIEDIPHLRKIAKETRNPFDRFHADCSFSTSVADDYLGTFVENSVKGFADIVLVPDEAGRGNTKYPGAFFTANIVNAESSFLKVPLGKFVVSAVGEDYKGWHLKLMVEVNRYLQQSGVQIVHMTTQSTNHAVMRNFEKLDYRYGKSTHVFACNG